MSYQSDIAEAVWTSETRTLDSESVASLDNGYIDAIGYAIWTAETRELDTVGPILRRRTNTGFKKNNIIFLGNV